MKKNQTKKKQTRRSRVPYPALDKKKNLKIRQDLIDYDYLDKLNPEEKKWLNQFTEEYTNASFKKDKLGRHSKNNLHKRHQTKACYNANNSRNRDIQSIASINNTLVKATVMVLETNNKTTKDDIENEVLAAIDLKKIENL